MGYCNLLTNGDTTDTLPLSRKVNVSPSFLSFKKCFMKPILVLFSIAVLLFLNSCIVHRSTGNSGKVPPGQAKKIYGTKSGKPFAPGQQKKR